MTDDTITNDFTLLQRVVYFVKRFLVGAIVLVVGGVVIGFFASWSVLNHKDVVDMLVMTGQVWIKGGSYFILVLLCTKFIFPKFNVQTEVNKGNTAIAIVVAGILIGLGAVL